MTTIAQPTLSRAPVHPFPARMAPELAATKVASLERNAVVLDPMMGSGTFPIAAARSGHAAIGCDSDPLAIVISETHRGDYNLADFVALAGEIAGRAATVKRAEFFLDSETSKFVDFWFDSETRTRLASLAIQIRNAPPRLAAPLWCAFSRLIITKDAGASRARDVSHSRPHRVRDVASFDPVDRFAASADAVAKRVKETSVGAASSQGGTMSIFRADARRLPLRDGSVDAVMTSPPYLLAIDYLRGHRMSLVWMGYSIGILRSLRTENIGSEAGLAVDREIGSITRASVSGDLSDRGFRIVDRYVRDIDLVVSEIDRVMTKAGRASFVIADAKLQGVPVSIEEILIRVGLRHSLKLHSRTVRELPESRRYLPPPREQSGSMNLRMKHELVLEFSH